MDSWINLGALGRIVLVGLLAGAGLPAMFALGLRALGGRQRQDSGQGRPAGHSVPTAPRVAAAVFCFAVVVAASGWGVFSIWRHS